jgi:uncharacterized membrane-anchored protein
MRFLAGLCLVVMAAVATAPVAAGQGPYPKTEEELQAAYDRLNWQTGFGQYKLPNSHATIQLRSGQAILLGADAERYSWLSSGTEFPDTEAVLTYDSSNASAEVYYEWRDEGYVTDSDWAEVDADQLLQDYRDGTEAANDERVSNGLEPMHVAGWLEPPHYDKSTHTVTYAIELKDKDGSWANAFALRLGRAGYTEFTWVGSIGLFQGAGGRPALLNQALAGHGFEEGYRYADYQDGDKVAAYGIAGLVAAAMGAKFGKGLIAALIAFVIAGKKIIIPAVLVGGAALLKFRKRLFGSGEYS